MYDVKVRDPLAPAAAPAPEEAGSAGLLPDALLAKLQFFGEPGGGASAGAAPSDDARVKAAVAAAQATNDAEPAVRALIDLPEVLRGRAVAALDGQSFKNLLARLPANRREELGPLMVATQDPERR